MIQWKLSGSLKKGTIYQFINKIRLILINFNGMLAHLVLFNA